MAEVFEVAGGELTVEGVSATALAERFGTPLFVTSERRLRENLRRFTGAFVSRYAGEVLVCVGMKANLGLAVRRVVVEEGGGGDAFGLGELTVALRAGTDPAKIVMNGPNKSDEVLRAAVASAITVNVDNLDELETLRRVASQVGTAARVALRIRLPLEELAGRRYVDPRYGPPGIDVVGWERAFKFGMEPASFFAAVERAVAADEVDLIGVAYHGGIPRRAGYHVEEVEDLMAHVVEARDRTGWAPETVNLGGGFVPPRRGVTPAPPSLQRYAEEITAALTTACDEADLALPSLVLEPGRYCWEDAVVWLTRVGNTKRDESLAHKTWVYVDGSINEMADPFDPNDRRREIIVANDPAREVAGPVDVCGPLCNAADVLAAARPLPPLSTGDLLAFLDMGAYNESFANQSNATPRSASVLVSEGRAEVVRRRETIEDLLARDTLASWLA